MLLVPCLIFLRLEVVDLPVPEAALAGSIVSICILGWLLYRWRDDISSRIRELKNNSAGAYQIGSAVLAVLGLSLIAAVFKNLPAGLLTAWLIIKVRERIGRLKLMQRDLVIESQAEVALQLISALYENNRDLMKSIKEAADCIQPPLADELKLTVAEYAAGGSLLKALQNLADRVDNREINVFVKGVVLSEQYGTDTVQVVQNVSSVISDRITLREELRNEMRGQVFNIAIFLTAIPVVVTILMVFFPDARQVLTSTMLGKGVIDFMIVIEYIAWRFGTGQEVIRGL